MKVLQINAVYGIGSTGRTARELSEELKKQGHTSLIATTKTNVCEDGIFMMANKIDQKAHAFLSRITGKQGYFSMYETKKLLRYMDKEKPDVVHLRNLHANFINIPMLLRYLAKKDIATVLTLHDCFFFTGKCTHYTEEGCFKWQTGCKNCPKLKCDNISWFFDRTKTMWKDKRKLFSAIPRLAVQGVSDWITEEGKKSFLQNAKIVKRIYNWIDTEKFYPREEDVKDKYNIPKDKFIVLLMSAGWKEGTDRYNDLLMLSGLVQDDIHIVCVGGGASDMNLPGNVTKINYIDGQDELSKVYSSSDVYVHLSREDTFGKVVAEALASGIPAVVYNSTGLPELVTEETGLVAENKNIYDVYEKIKLIKENGKKYYNEACVKSVKEKFIKEKLTEETIKLYEEITKK